MSRPFWLAIGGLIALASIGVLVFSATRPPAGALGGDMSWVAQFLGTTGVIAGAIGLVIGAMVMALGMGRWQRPKPVTSRAARKHEGLRE